MQGKDIGITVLVVHLHAIRTQLAFPCLLVGKLQVFNADYPVKQVTNSFIVLSLQVCLYIRILRVAPTKPFYLICFCRWAFAQLMQPRSGCFCGKVSDMQLYFYKHS